MAEPQSIISFAIEKGIKDNPVQALAVMVKLVQKNARLEGEVAMLYARVAQLADLERHYGFSG